MDQLSFRFTFPFFCMYRMRLSLFWVHFRPHCRSVDLSCISCAFILRFRSSECTACVYHSFECTFGPTVARSVFQFHSKKGLLGALVLRPLSLGRSLMDLLLLLVVVLVLVLVLVLLLLLLLLLALLLLVLVLVLLLFVVVVRCCCSLLLLVVVFGGGIDVIFWFWLLIICFFSYSNFPYKIGGLKAATLQNGFLWFIL